MANVVITNKKHGEFRALMLIQRMVNKKGEHKLILSCTGGKWNSIEVMGSPPLCLHK
jgi:hypothetical protein